MKTCKQCRYYHNLQCIWWKGEAFKIQADNSCDKWIDRKPKLKEKK